MNATTVVIGLELDESSGSLAGRITDPDGEVTEFRGWVGLIAALDALVRGRCATCRDEAPMTTPQGGTQ